jgi:phage N-6-adenine-methyltransferase
MEELQRQLWKKTGISAPSSKLEDRWRTPPNVFRGAQSIIEDAPAVDWLPPPLPFYLDAAATAEDSLCPFWISPEINALDSKPWILQRTARIWDDTPEEQLPPADDHPWTAWVNPPYSNHPQSSQYLWAQRCSLAASRGWTVALLIPAAPTTRCGQLCAMTAHEIHYTAGRIAFLHPDSGKPVKGNPLGSQLVIFRPSPDPILQVRYGWNP